jgi:hypothetical protein
MAFHIFFKGFCMNNLLASIKQLYRFQASHKPISALVWLFSFLAGAAFLVPHHLSEMPALVCVAVLVAYFVFHMLYWYEKALNARISAGNESPIWDVSVNGIDAGTISDSLYASVRRDVFFDARVWAAQLFNLGGVLNRTIDYLFLAIPLGAFWFALGCYVFSPDSFVSIVSGIQRITPEQVVASVPLLIQMLVVISLFMVVVMAALGKRFGFVNHFDQAIAKRVRQHVKCVAEGDVSLSRMVDGSVRQPTEMALARPQKED